LPDVSDEHFYQNFVKDAQAMQEMGLPVYWLGREFTAGDLTFRGPYGGDFGGEVEGGGINMDYTASLPKANEDFHLTVYSEDAWALVKESIANPKTRGVLKETVFVGGHEGQLLAVPAGTRPLNALWLVLPLDNVVAVALAAAGGPVTPVTGPLQKPSGPDWSPFINDPDLFVQVLQNLRPYPQ
jgi:hypothetical protein